MNSDDETNIQILEKLRDIHVTQRRFGLFFTLFSLLVIFPVMAMAGILLVSVFYGFAQVGQMMEDPQFRGLPMRAEETRKATVRVEKSLEEMVKKAFPYESQNFKK